MKKRELEEQARMLETCLKYIDKLQQRKYTTPYHYLTTKEGKDGVKQQGLVNAAELSAHVQTADKLGRETCLTTDGTQLNVCFVEKSAPVPWDIQGAISRMKLKPAVDNYVKIDLKPSFVVGKAKKVRKGKK